LDRAIGSPFSPRGLTFENYSEAHGLPNNTVYGVHSDASGALWLSTNRGVASLDRDSKRFRPFFRSHGLQGDEFNLGAHFRTASGELMFGGSNGYNAFVPERLRFNERPPAVVLTGFLIFNAPADLGTSYASVSKIDLGHRDDVITFQFAALDFTAPGQNRYLYKLDGFDTDWVEADKTRQASYTNLSGGEYTFRVRAANSDGVWNEAGLAIPISVEAPPWARWWAYVLYVSAIFLMMYLVWAQQQKKVLREASYARRLQAEVAARTSELAERNSQLQHANSQLQEASVTDPMTGLGNRRSLYNAVNALLQPDAAGHVSTQRIVLMIVDLDRLKPVNDQYGHEAGDRMIVQIGELLKQVSRSTDLVVRWGGDEFVVVCRDADMSIAMQLAERMRGIVAKQLFRVGAGRAARTSCSIGFAPYPFVQEFPECTTWEQSLALADAALYQAKRTRNSWVGIAGKARAAQLPQLVQSIEADALQLEHEGFIELNRRPAETEDTVDRILALGGPGI
jgi:diguanylate cyclase (GGDEF)-like protein